MVATLDAIAVNIAISLEAEREMVVLVVLSLLQKDSMVADT